MNRRTLSLAAIGGVAIVLALAVLALSLYSSRPHSRRTPEGAETSNDPHVLLAEANRLSWLFNWPQAGPLYQRAQTLFTRVGDARNALYAQIGFIRSQAETMSFVDISDFLAAQLESPLVQHDPRLHLWCLVSKGMTDIEIDVAAAKRDWEEAESLAEGLGEHGWANRARGELGLLAFLEGDSRKARRLVGKALLSAMANGDVGGEVRYLEFIGNGMNELNREYEAIPFFNRAIKVAKSTPDAGCPFMAYEGKATALVALNREPEAETLLEEALGEAQAQSKLGHETQLLILLGELARKSGHDEQAPRYLEEAAQRANKLHFYRMDAQAMFDLATIYREKDNLAEAEDRLNKGIDASRKVGDRYYLPRDLTALAELKAQIGHLTEAHQLYRQAEDIIDGMLSSTPGPYTESTLVGAMSSVYLGDFALAAAQRDTATAFNILERVRGRTAADMLRNHTWTPYESASSRELEGELSKLQVRLMRSNDVRERDELLDNIVEAEEKLSYNRDSVDLPSPRMSNHPIPLRLAQDMLRPDEAVVEYVLAEPTAFCLTVTHDHSGIVSLGAGRKKIEALVSEYVSAIEDQKLTADQARQLYSLLLDPLPAEARKFRLIIVPDGRLYTLPFECLRDGAGRYVIWSHVVSYAPSATTLYFLRSTKRSHLPELAFLGVGGVRYGADHPLLASNSTTGRILRAVRRGFDELVAARLNNLPASRLELTDASHALKQPNAVLLMGDDATETAFKRQPLGNFKILHLAVHAVAEPRFPERAALILGRDPNSDDDGLLQAREIASLPLTADLVTLSACDTAKGKAPRRRGQR
jgi:CHAT domain-containing protein